jgi:hypothetical protein
MNLFVPFSPLYTITRLMHLFQWNCKKKIIFFLTFLSMQVTQFQLRATKMEYKGKKKNINIKKVIRCLKLFYSLIILLRINNCKREIIYMF